MNTPIRFFTVVLAALVLVPFACWGQTTTSALQGVLTDPAGAIVVNADIELTEKATGFVRSTKPNELGIFRFAGLPPGDYELSIKAPGFKSYVQSDIMVISSSTRDLGRIRLELGTLTEQVFVTAEVTPVQTASSEKSSLVAGPQLNKLALKGRDMMVMLMLIPGVYVNTGAFAAETTSQDGIRQVRINGMAQGRVNFQVDGVVDLDTGSHETTHYEPNMDSIAEIRVLTAGYQAEYGRSSGGTVSVVTKSGGREFHGTAWAVKRHEMFNANTWLNNRNGVAKPPYRYFIGGFSVTGPAYIPKVFNTDKNRLFFHFSQEYTRTKPSTSIIHAKVPTALERAGDFSQSFDSAGKLIPLYDPITRQPIPGNKIAPSLASPQGLAMLNFFPMPNRCDLAPGDPSCWNETDATQIHRRNYRTQYTSKHPRRNDVLRFDANLTSKLNTFFRYINDYDLEETSGNIALKNAEGKWVPYSEDHPNPGHGYAVGITYTVSPRVVNEFTFGKSYNTWDWYPHDPSQVDRARMGNPPHWFDQNAPSFKNDGNLKRPGLPNGAQNFAYWTPAVTGGTVSSPHGGNRPYTNWNDIYSFNNNISWLRGAHSIKAGIYYERTGKVQQAGSGTYLGSYSFASSSAFPFDTGYGNANMFLGNFNSYSEGGRVMGDYWFTNVEAFVQDSWKVHRRLTLDIGVRFYHLKPQENLNKNSAMWVPSSYDPAKAGRLYWRGCKVPTAGACSTANQIAIDPVTGYTTYAALAGTFVPYSVGGYAQQPDFFNGMEVAGVSSKIPLSLFEVPKFKPAFRFGIAWDVFGNGKTAIRTSFGQFYHRGDGNQIMGFGGQPPITYTRTAYYSNISQIPSLAATAAVSPISSGGIVGKQPYEVTMNLHFGIQQAVGFGTVVEAAYVGNLMRHSTRTMGGTVYMASRQMNPIPMFSRYDPQYVDPWSPTTPKRSQPDNLLRPLKGVGAVTNSSFQLSGHYHSAQLSVRREMRRGISYGMAYTWSKTMTLYGLSPYPTVFSDKGRYRGSTGVPHMLNFFYIYELPKLGAWLNLKPLGWITDNWSISGITSIQGHGYASAPGISFTQTTTVNPAPEMTGSAEGARMIVVGNPNKPKSEWKEWDFFNWQAFQVPMPCSWTPQATPQQGIGQSMSCFGNAGSGQLIKIPTSMNNWDITFAKSFPYFGEGRSLIFRAEMYNIWNHTQISGVNTTIQFNLPDWQKGILTQTNNQLMQYTGARDPRRMAMTLRFEF
ncbi:MAG: carboxypeptidase regulatory-like domain-containing protein [Bryobacteraceae bacterium]|nr:carboxypeptidase regulatory-like domain-containing protein [Bryobacteraceae bacterium]